MSKLHHVKARTVDEQNGNGRFLLELLGTHKFYAAGLLLNQGKLINLKCMDSEGNTALHLAVKNKQEHLVQILVNLGSEIQLQNGEKLTPVDIAKSQRSTNLIAYFEKTIQLSYLTERFEVDRSAVHIHFFKERKMQESTEEGREKLKRSMASFDIIDDINQDIEITKEDFVVAGAINDEG